MTQAEELAELRAARIELEEVLAATTLEQVQRPGAAGDWSVRDVLAHLLWESAPGWTALA